MLHLSSEKQEMFFDFRQGRDFMNIHDYTPMCCKQRP